MNVRLTALPLLLLSGAIHAQTIAVNFNHLGRVNDTVRMANDGDRIDITIENTCADAFVFSVEGKEKQPVKSAGSQAATVGPSGDDATALKALNNVACIPEDRKNLDPIYYNAKFGGYDVKIKPKSDGVRYLFKNSDSTSMEKSIISGGVLRECYFDKDAAGKETLITDRVKTASCLDSKKVADNWSSANSEKPLVKVTETIFTLNVEESSWRYDFAGGIFLSHAVNERYSAVAGDGGKYTIVHNAAGEDDFGAGIGMFVHASPKSGTCNMIDMCWVPLTLGFGASNQSDLNIFAGTSVRFGRNAFFTLGWNFSEIDTLPGELKVGDSISDPNALTSLSKKRVKEPFFSFTYTFFGDGGATMQKRIMPAD